MAYGWEGEMVRLVPLDAEKHLDNAQRWVNDPRVMKTLGMVAYPITRGYEKAFFERADKRDPNDVTFAIETLADDRHIGFCGIHNIDWVSGYANTGTIIGDPADWGKGYGTDVVAVRTWYAFQILNLRYLKSSYLSDNLGSRRMNEKVGFREYGMIPDAVFRAGTYHNETFLYLTREMWMEATRGRKPGQ